MANVQEILNQIDQGIASYMPVITELQDKYKQENGRYWQGLFTHSSAPVDENSESPDNLGTSPTDQESSWNDIAGAVIPDEMLSRIRIDSYNSSNGHGFVVVVEKIINSETYTKRYNVGPEKGRSTEWEISDQ